MSAQAVEMTDSVLIRGARRLVGSEGQIGVLWNWLESLADALEDVMANGRAMLSPETCERHGMGAKGVNCGLCQDAFEIALDSVDGYVP